MSKGQRVDLSACKGEEKWDKPREQIWALYRKGDGYLQYLKAPLVFEVLEGENLLLTCKGCHRLRQLDWKEVTMHVCRKPLHSDNPLNMWHNWH